MKRAGGLPKYKHTEHQLIGNCLSLFSAQRPAQCFEGGAAGSFSSSLPVTLWVQLADFKFIKLFNLKYKNSSLLHENTSVKVEH